MREPTAFGLLTLLLAGEEREGARRSDGRYEAFERLSPLPTPLRSRSDARSVMPPLRGRKIGWI
jgi:hypothetical protein